MYVRMIKVREEIHQQMIGYLLENDLKHLLKPLEDVILRELFEEEMMHLVEENLFKTQDIFRLFYSCFQVITEDFKDFSTLENLEQYTYHYALKLSYDSVEVKEMTDHKNKIARLAYLF